MMLLDRNIGRIKATQGDIMVIFSSSIGNTLWVLLVISLALPYYMEHRREKLGADPGI